MFDISSIINTQAIPVFLLPLNGLLCGVFYTRYSNINSRIHTLQGIIKDLLDKHKDSKKNKHLLKSTRHELQELHRRSTMILITLTCLLLSVISFCICAALITLTIKYPSFFKLALSLWFLSPFLMVMGILSGLRELFVSKKTVYIQSHLIDFLEKQEDTAVL